MAFSEKSHELSLHFIETSQKQISITSSKNLLSQIEHRIMLTKSWNIKKGSRVLEIGCGQGDCTIVLGDAVGENGHVYALDPGSPDYGAPFTLSQSQNYISKSPIGPRVTFHNASPIAYLESYTGPKYDYAIMCHCLYYFESPLIFPSILSALLPHTKALCVAEWSLHVSKPSSYPHVLTALLLSTIEASRETPAHGNIRTVESPKQYKKAIEGSGFVLQEEQILESNEGLRDAYWEVSDTLAQKEAVLKELREEEGWNEKRAVALEAMYDSLEGSVRDLEEGVKGVHSMDVWVAKFGVAVDQV